MKAADKPENTRRRRTPDSHREYQSAQAFFGDYIMPLPPVRIAFNDWCFRNSIRLGALKPEDIIFLAGCFGVDGLSIDYFLMTRDMKRNLRRVRESIDTCDLDIVMGYSLPFALPRLCHRIFDPRKEEMFNIAHELGTDTIRIIGGIVIPSPYTAPIHFTVDRNQEIFDVSRRIREFTRYARLEGITVALETRGEYTTREILEIIDRVDEPNFRVTFDTSYPLLHHEDPIEAIMKLSLFISFVHVKDIRRDQSLITQVPLGTGEVPLREIIHTLRERNYDGLYSIEFFLAPWKTADEEATLRESIFFLESITDDAPALP